MSNWVEWINLGTQSDHIIHPTCSYAAVLVNGVVGLCPPSPPPPSPTDPTIWLWSKRRVVGLCLPNLHPFPSQATDPTMWLRSERGFVGLCLPSPSTYNTPNDSNGETSRMNTTYQSYVVQSKCTCGHSVILLVSMGSVISLSAGSPVSSTSTTLACARTCNTTYEVCMLQQWWIWPTYIKNMRIPMTRTGHGPRSAHAGPRTDDVFDDSGPRDFTTGPVIENQYTIICSNHYTFEPARPETYE